MESLIERQRPTGVVTLCTLKSCMFFKRFKCEFDNGHASFDSQAQCLDYKAKDEGGA